MSGADRFFAAFCRRCLASSGVSIATGPQLAATAIPCAHLPLAQRSRCAGTRSRPAGVRMRFFCRRTQSPAVSVQR